MRSQQASIRTCLSNTRWTLLHTRIVGSVQPKSLLQRERSRPDLMKHHREFPTSECNESRHRRFLQRSMVSSTAIEGNCSCLGSVSFLVKHELIWGKWMILWAPTALLFTSDKSVFTKSETVSHNDQLYFRKMARDFNNRWVVNKAKSEQLSIDRLRSYSSPCFLHQHVVNWHPTHRHIASENMAVILQKKWVWETSAAYVWENFV